MYYLDLNSHIQGKWSLSELNYPDVSFENITLQKPMNLNQSIGSWYEYFNNTKKDTKVKQPFMSINWWNVFVSNRNLEDEGPVEDDDYEQKLVKLNGVLKFNVDQARSNSVSFRLESLYYRPNGTVYFHGYNTINDYHPNHLLSLLPNSNTFEIGKNILNKTIDNEYKYFQSYSSNLYSSTQCYILGICQLTPFDKSKATPEDILNLEKEFETPTGLPTIDPILVSSKIFFYSPNCPGVIGGNFQHLPEKSDNAQSRNLKDHSGSQGDDDQLGYLKGIRREVQSQYLVRLAGITVMFQIIMNLLLIYQMEYTYTPSRVSKVSAYTITFQAIIDGYCSFIPFALSAVFPHLSSTFIMLAFFLLVLSLFQLQYLMTIWRIQAPESPSTQDANNPNLGYLLLKFYVILGIGSTILFKCLPRQTDFQQIGLIGLFFVHYSFWIPQIVRSIIRGSTPGLSPLYIFGTSVIRLLIPIYLFTIPNNLFFGFDDPKNSDWVWYLVGYVFGSGLLVYLQSLIGPRFFVPRFLLPPTYDYYRLPSEPSSPADEEAAPSTEPVADPDSDCSICMLPIDFSRSSRIIGRPEFMRTPCGHTFHSECLVRWMGIKLECPVCRSGLPPI